MKLILIMVLVVSCSVRLSEINKAQELCKNNGGIKFISPSYDYPIKCSNGARFELK